MAWAPPPYDEHLVTIVVPINNKDIAFEEETGVGEGASSVALPL